MAMKRTRGQRAFAVVNSALLILLGFTTLYPFLHELTISVSHKAEALRQGVHIFPLTGFNFSAYLRIAESRYLWIGYGNTVIRTVAGTALSVAVTALLAYPLSKATLPLKRTFTSLIFITMLFSGGLIPLYLLVRNLRLLDTRTILVLGNLVSGFNVIIMRNFFISLPASLEESAYVDGAGQMRTFISIAVPLSIPVIATVTLWQAVWHWNSWFDATIYITSNNKQVLQVILRKLLLQLDPSSDISKSFFLQQEGRSDFTSVTVKAAIIMAYLLPIMAVYPLIQKYFLKGIFLGAVKG